MCLFLSSPFNYSFHPYILNGPDPIERACGKQLALAEFEARAGWKDLRGPGDPAWQVAYR